MKSIEINYFQPLTGLFAKQCESLEVESDTNLLKLLDKLFYRYREKFKKYEIDPKSGHIVIMLNGKTLSKKELSIELNNNDSIVLWMPVAGG